MRLMRATEIEELAYVARRGGDRLYEIERIENASVILRNVLVPADECTGAYGSLRVTKLDLIRDYRVVRPAPDELDALLVA